MDWIVSVAAAERGSNDVLLAREHKYATQDQRSVSQSQGMADRSSRSS